MIDYKESLKRYGELFNHYEAKSDICQWYQNKCRFYNDEVVYKEEFPWHIISGILFYVIVMPIIFCIWGSIMLFFKIKNRK